MNHRLAAVLGLVLSLSGCTQIFDALANSSSPHSLTASHGEGAGISLSWSAPSLPEGDGRTVVSYEVERDGTWAASTAGTGWTDYAVAMATRHSYRVRAGLSDGSRTGWSSSDTGWYITSEAFLWGTQTRPQTGTSRTGWFRTLVVSGWTYHWSAAGAAPTLTLRDWDSLDSLAQVAAPGGSWTAPKTGKIWIEAGSGTWTGWYE